VDGCFAALRSKERVVVHAIVGEQVHQLGVALVVFDGSEALDDVDCWTWHDNPRCERIMPLSRLIA
jgi:hypothetical protein